jgi:hypothetical protein
MSLNPHTGFAQTVGITKGELSKKKKRNRGEK